MVIQELVLGASQISTVEKQELNISWPLSRHKFKNGSIKTCYNSWLQCDLYLQRMPFGLLRMFPLIVCAYSY